MTNDLSNIDQFHKCVGVVLNLLYESFPNPLDFDIKYMEGRGLPADKRALVNFDDEMQAWNVLGHSCQQNPVVDEMKVYMNALHFLRDEGYVRSIEPEHGQDQRIFYECKLTSKGLAALGRSGVKEKNNWGQLIHAAIRDGKYKLLQELVGKVLFNSLT